MVLLHAVGQRPRPLGGLERPRRAPGSLRKRRIRAQPVSGSADEHKSDSQWQDKLGSLAAQAGAWWSSVRPRPAEASKATAPESGKPDNKQEADPSATAGTGSAGSGSMQQVGQSRQLSFRQPAVDSETKQEDAAAASAASDASPTMAQAPDSRVGGLVPDDAPSALLNSWDAVPVSSSEAIASAAEDSGTGWAGLEPDPPPQRRRLAGNVLFSGLLAGIGIASALALQRYGSWRQQNPLASEGRLAPVAVATQPADAVAAEAPAGNLAAVAAEEGTASDGDAGPTGGHDRTPAPLTAGVVQGQSADSHDFQWDDAPAPSVDKAHAAAPGGEEAAAVADPQHGGSTQHAALVPAHDALGDRHGHQASALPPPATGEAPRQPARKLPIRTQEGAAALERMRRLQQRRQQLYSQLQERQEQRYRQAFGFDDEAQAESAQPAAPRPQQQQLEAGEQQGQAPPAQPDAEQPAQQQGAPVGAGEAGLEAQQAEGGPAEEDAELHLQDSSVRWLLRELEREEQREAAALAEQAEALASAAGSMSTAAVRQRAAAAHRAAATAARHAQRATAAFSTAAEAATAAANSAQRAASAAARAQVAVERRWAVEAEKAAAQAKQAAEDGAAAAQKAAVASARSVMAKHDVHRQAQLAAQAAELTKPLTVREKATAAWQATSRGVRAAPGAAQRLAAHGEASGRQALAASQAALQRSNSALREWAAGVGHKLSETAGHVRAALSGATKRAGEFASSLRARSAAAVDRLRSPRQPRA